ncbi:hypothetical protein [Lacihabitans sp. CCS-44]|uniref:hypothetical protein n=1 Tax=Lacihabitans sp. CCS-44 TaxID=2487331 RepID=UPI0020CE74B8|nr:hypothetical protein [Lacihabitans sp. CCS-44]
MTITENALSVIEDLNFRPLILTKTQVSAILAIPNFKEICFYLTKEDRGLRNQEKGVFTLRYGIIDTTNRLVFFDGIPIGRGFNLNNFHNSNEKFEVTFSTAGTPFARGTSNSSNSGVVILNSNPREYFLTELSVNLNAAAVNTMAGFFVTKNLSGNYEVHVAILATDFGVGGGPGSTNTKPGP